MELRALKDEILANFLCDLEDIDYSSLSSTRKKHFIEKYESELPQIYFKIEMLEKKFNRGDNIRVENINQSIKLKILIPHPSIPTKFYRAIYRLLSSFDTTDPVRLYRFNKKRLYDIYNSSTESKKEWLIKYISKNYLDKKA